LNENSTARQPEIDTPVETWLWPAFARGIRDNIIGEVVFQLIRIAGFLVLVRALMPSDFGLFRVLVTISAIVMTINELGVPGTLVQRQMLRSDHETSAAWANLAVSAFTAGALYVTAPLIARAMAMPAMPPALHLLCIPILLEGMISVPIARLTRRMKFGVLALAEVVGEVGFLATAMTLLVLDLPRWSLAGGLAARMSCHALMIWSVEPYVPRGKPSWKAVLELRGFAGSVVAGRFLCTVSSNADYLLVGRLLGSSALGFYSIAWDLLRFVPDRLYKVADRVTVPAFCRIQDRPEELRRAFLNFLDQMNRLIEPPLVCVAIAAPELLLVMYGPHWIGAATPLRILSVGVITIGLRAGMGSVYYSKGWPSFDVYLHGFRLLLIAIAISITSSHGLFWVCVAMSAVEVSVSIIGQAVACLMIGAGIPAVSAALLPGFKTTAACGLAAVAGKILAVGLVLNGLCGLAVIVLPPSAAFFAIEGGRARQMIRGAFAFSGSRVTEPVQGQA